MTPSAALTAAMAPFFRPIPTRTDREIASDFTALAIRILQAERGRRRRARDRQRAVIEGRMAPVGALLGSSAASAETMRLVLAYRELARKHRAAARASVAKAERRAA